MKPTRLLLILVIVIGLLTGCNQLTKATKKLGGGLSELLGRAVGGFVEATVKMVFMGLLSTEQAGPQLLSFEGETPSERTFKGVALGAVRDLQNGDVQIRGRGVDVRGDKLLLANGLTPSALPLVMIAVENDSTLRQPGNQALLQGTLTLDFAADSLRREDSTPTVFRYIGETEKNLKLVGIGHMMLPSAVFEPNDNSTRLRWQGSGELRFEGRVIGSGIGQLVQAQMTLRTTLPNGIEIEVDGVIYGAYVLDEVPAYIGVW